MDKVENNSQDYMMTLEIWGRSLVIQKKYMQAEATLNEAANIINSAPSKLHRTTVLTTIAELYFSWGKLEKGVEYAQQAKELALEYKLWRQLKRLYSVYGH